MQVRAEGERVQWYRVPIGRENLSALNKKSDFLAFAQTLGYLGLLAVTGTAAYFTAMKLPLPWNILAAIPVFYFHGMCWQFMINGFHELIHDSVFKTRWLNPFFLRIFSFLGWYNHVQFWASHTEHHKFTLHPPDDLEVTLPAKFDMKGVWKYGIVNPLAWKWFIGGNIRFARGILAGKWEHYLFDDQPELRQKLFNWSRFVLFGHALIFAVSMYMHWWVLPLIVSFPLCYGGALHMLCNNSQHIGLRDNVPDFRLCCRTIYLNPFFQFLYWHMNYHTEHHMYAAVPCYKLPRLHRLMKNEMPPCPNGLRQTWTEIMGILKKQEEDPTYVFTAPIPPKSTPAKSEPVSADAAGLSPQVAPVA